jgi:molybdate transport system ATP-binding protein
MQNPSIIVKDLSVRNKDSYALEGISFSLMPGQHLAITGSSGSGKTLLAKALAGKIFSSGKIETNFATGFASKVAFVEHRNSFKNLSGTTDFYYQQRFNSFDSADAPTILQQLLLIVAGRSEMEKREKIESGLKKLGILHLKDSSLIQLSSGEQKRFQLIKALLNPPALLILDGPFTGLDVAARKGLEKILQEVMAAGTQIIVIPGTFQIPDCITHVLKIEDKHLSFFGEKEDAEITPNYFSAEKESAFEKELLPGFENEYSFETIVKMENVSIRYGDRLIFKNLDWKITSGEKWLVKGPNGAGKSSLLNLISGDHPQAYSNRVFLFGKRRGTGESIWDIKQKMGYVSAELHACFDTSISCYDTIGSGFFDTVGLYKKLTNGQHKIILQWLDFLHLSSHVYNKPLLEFSTGVQRLIFLARALVKNPPLLILDEPCQGLDFQQRDLFISLIDEICSAADKTLIYVTHEEEDVPACIQKVLELAAGKQTFFDLKKIDVFETAVPY